MSDEHAVAAIIPAFDNEAYLAAAIESVLDQTVAPVEVLVVDDGSTDSSASVARRYEPRVRVISTPNGGPGSARNNGITATSAPWIAICDADDLWLPTRLERQLDLVSAAPATGAVFTWINEFVSPEIDPSALPNRPPMALATGPLPSSLLMRRSAFEAAGPFDTSLRVGEWIDWYSRLVDTGTVIATVEEVLVRRRHHHRNTSSREATHQHEFLRSMRAHIARTRRAPS